MASIDRYQTGAREGYQPPVRKEYQPPREGYQPPSLPQATGGFRNDRHSHSPTARRRDVPPSVPTPPIASRRTSPPRPKSRQEQQQQSQSQQPQPQPQQQHGSSNGGLKSPDDPGPPPPNSWIFTAEEVSSTPSILDGLAPAEERLRRAKGVNFIYQAGVLLDLPQITLWVAGVFFHRLYMRLSMVEEKGGVHHYNIAATSLFLANKVEENCRKTKDMIITAAKIAQKNPKLHIDEQNKEYWRWRDSILHYEEVMLEQLTFDLMIDNPYRMLFEILGQLGQSRNKDLRQSAWAFCNDACLTSLPLLMPARDIAIAAIFFASVHTGNQIDDVDGDAWWRYVNGNETRCSDAIVAMRQLYLENPLKKQNPSLPSPPFRLNSTRRRGDTASSATGTPAGAADNDRGGTQSPRVRINGSDGLASPTKRKATADSDLDSDSGRQSKITRADGEEGEITDS